MKKDRKPTKAELDKIDQETDPNLSLPQLLRDLRLYEEQLDREYAESSCF